ncbi:MAG TPA: MATE family efflux transporter [Pirellulales bacterium]|nr:MATE family efflux transporter [Pirellulales bacterium]
MLQHVETWWRRPAGMREVLVLALPLIVSTLSWTLMNFTDRVFLVWYSPDAVAAALPAGMMAFMVICFPLGVAAYVNTFVAQYQGAKRPERIGPVVWQALFIGFATVPLTIATIPLAPLIFEMAGHGPEIAAMEVDYYQAICWGEGAVVVCSALSSFFTGRGDVRTVMIVDSFAALLNVALDYAWIFGHWGFPEMGAAGAAWATTVATLIRAAIYLALWFRPSYRELYQTVAGCRFDRQLFGRLLWFGFPNGLQYFFEVGAFSFYLLMVGQLGAQELAASNLAFNVNSLAFMPVYGIGIATGTLVGQYLGENRAALAARATWSAFTIAAGLMALVGSLYVFAPEWLLLAYEAEVGRERFTELRELTVVLLRFVAFYCLFDAMNIVFSAAIKGAGDTRFVLVTTLGASALPVAMTWVGVHWFGYGLLWSWVSVTAWVCLLGVIFQLRFMQGRWRTMRVIEQAAEPLLEMPSAEERRREWER